MTLKKVAETKDEIKHGGSGYCEQLFKTDKRYYRIVRTRSGEMYNIYTNESTYGEKDYDKEMIFDNRVVREFTIKDCKESIKMYDIIN